jgi:hypothetical protein
MNLAEVIAEIGTQYRCIDGLPTNVCQTGDSYVTLGHEGIYDPNVPDLSSDGGHIPGTVREGRPKKHFDSEDEACRDLVHAFKTYAAWWCLQKGAEQPILYWRYDSRARMDAAYVWNAPGGGECFSSKPGPKKRRVFRAWCRLCLSDKPVIYRDLDELHEARELARHHAPS